MQQHGSTLPLRSGVDGSCVCDTTVYEYALFEYTFYEYTLYEHTLYEYYTL